MISYKVYKKISEECKKLLLAVGIADSFEAPAKEKPAANTTTNAAIIKIALVMALAVMIIIVKQKKKNR